MAVGDQSSLVFNIEKLINPNYRVTGRRTVAAKNSGMLLIFVFHHLKNRKCHYKTEEMLIKSCVSSKTLIFWKVET